MGKVHKKERTIRSLILIQYLRKKLPSTEFARINVHKIALGIISNATRFETHSNITKTACRSTRHTEVDSLT